ncbi:MAG TPA: type I methionyl aminopeptidase [Anaerohalosphaeraceae bacterium]|nr:type I methionyl aminopeptidase [Anaerohalosphaeraceae bacterium]HOL31094.1 type I methionyl aminopeptidase [Anaerohalosphaeraceae bacterium]HPO69780.1 type I methionyl aminopeptidase [Anaerohalosphaeraceae bacterium]
MPITLRSSREIELIRKAGIVVANVLSKLNEYAKPGVSTAELDDLAMEMTHQAGAVALFKGVPCPYKNRPFPGGICTSINEQLVHGIPSPSVILKEGDILSIDFGVRLNGYCGDAAITVGIGSIAPERQRLLDVTSRLLQVAVEYMAPGVKWSMIARMMEDIARQAKFSIVRDYVGHGIGTEMHEDPKVPNFVSPELLHNDILLREGMVLAVEPMVNMGTAAVKTLSDGWTVVTKDKKCSAHFEHTIAVVSGGCRVLTALP